MLEQKDAHGDYFEGTIQLRNPSDELVAFVKQLIAEGHHVWISREKKVRGGIDIRVSSIKFLRRLPEHIKLRFYGYSKITTTLFSRNRQTQKNIYRVTVLFREAKFKRGDLLVVKGIEMQVMGIPNKAQLKEVVSGKKRLISFDEVQEASKKSTGG